MAADIAALEALAAASEARTLARAHADKTKTASKPHSAPSIPVATKACPNSSCVRSDGSIDEALGCFRSLQNATMSRKFRKDHSRLCLKALWCLKLCRRSLRDLFGSHQLEVAGRWMPLDAACGLGGSTSALETFRSLRAG